MNSDRTIVALGTSLGFQVFSIEPSFMRRIRRTLKGGVKIAEVIDTTDLILLVPTGHCEEEGTSNQILFWNDQDLRVVQRFDMA